MGSWKCRSQEEYAQQLLVMANLPPEVRLECEGIIILGFEVQVMELIKYLEQLISEKEEAYQEYKNKIKTEILDSQKKSE